MNSLKYYILIGLLAICSTTWAQQKGKPTAEEMNERKWEHLKTTAKLSDSEAQAVKPIFKEYEESIWKLHEANRAAYRNNKKAEKPNYKELNDNTINTEVKQAEYLQAYHQKLEKILPPETLFNYYHAERSYKRMLIYEMQQNHQKREAKPQNEKK